MGQKVSNFISNVGKSILKAGVSAVGSFIPYVGPTLANAINSQYRHGGKVHKFAMGGRLKNIPDGLKEKAINSKAELLKLIKKYPNEARLAGLSEEDLKVEEDTAMGAGRMGAQAYGNEGVGAGRREAQETERPTFAHGGVASLPISNLDRLNRYAVGGEVSLAPGDKEQSFVILQHGHPSQRMPRKRFVS